jgi:hypothetical protein
MRKLMFGAAMLAGLAGCSTVFEGRSQSIAVTTTPPDASCTFTRHGETLGTISSTPGALLIEKTKYEVLITCKKDGYEPATLVDASDSAAATAGNVLGGLILAPVFWAVDSATGADNKYNSPVSLTLVKTGEATTSSN